MDITIMDNLIILYNIENKLQQRTQVFYTLRLPKSPEYKIGLPSFSLEERNMKVCFLPNTMHPYSPPSHLWFAR